MKNAKTKAVDLGALQTSRDELRKKHQASSRALQRAQEVHDTDKKAYETADSALRDAMRVVANN